MNLSRLKRFKKISSEGFTLIELLIVIAILGVLAAGILVALDPVEQLARGRDAGRKSAATETGRAFQAYYTANGAYPTIGQWTDAVGTNVMVVSGEIKVIPSQTTTVPATACSGGSLVNNFCYKVSAVAGLEDIVYYTHVDSKLERNKGACGNTAANTWYAYYSYHGRAGTVCQAAEPKPDDSTIVLN